MNNIKHYILNSLAWLPQYIELVAIIFTLAVFAKG